MAGFEGHDGGGGGGRSGAVFLGDIVVLLLEVEHCGKQNEVKPNECVAE